MSSTAEIYESSERYASHQEQADVVRGYLRTSIPLLEALNMNRDADVSRTLLKSLETDAFKLLVIGEFKRGKSTFINAMLGEEVLPAYSTPCTAVISEVRFSEDRRARLHFHANASETDLELLPEEVAAHITKHKGAELPPIELETSDLEPFLTIQDFGADQEAAVASAPYKKAEILWPLDLCRQGVQIVDSPGLNEHKVRSTVTNNYLSQVDAIMFVMSAQAMGSQSELNVIERNIRGAGHENLFFIINRFDEIRRESDRERLINHAYQILEPLTSGGRNNIFFLSALDALEGRINNQEERIQSSGILEFEAALSKFLVHDRGRVKLLQPIVGLSRTVSRALNRNVIHEFERLDLDEEEFRQAYEQLQEQISIAKERRALTNSRLQLTRERLVRQLVQLVEGRQRQLADMLPELVADHVFEERMGWISKDAKEAAYTIADEVVTVLTEKIEREQSVWRRDVFEPKSRELIEKLAEDTAHELGGVLIDLESAADRLSGIKTASHRSDALLQDVAVNRLLSGQNWLQAAGVDSDYDGDTMVMKEMVGAIVPHVAIGTVMLTLGVLNPFILIPALLGGGMLQRFWKSNSVSAKLREKIIAEIAVSIRDNISETSDEIKHNLDNELDAFLTNVSAGLLAEIVSIETAAHADMATREKGMDEILRRKKELSGLRRELSTLSDQLNNQLAEMSFAVR